MLLSETFEICTLQFLGVILSLSLSFSLSISLSVSHSLSLSLSVSLSLSLSLSLALGLCFFPDAPKTSRGSWGQGLGSVGQGLVFGLEAGRLVV